MKQLTYGNTIMVTNFQHGRWTLTQPNK